MTQSTYFNQVKNVLKVLQGYTKGIRFLLVMLLTLCVSAEVWADYTIAFKSTDGADGSTAQTTIENLISSGGTNVSTISATRAYNGKSGYGIKLGSSSSTGNVIMTLANSAQIKASKLVVKAAYYDSNKTLKVTVTYTDNTTTNQTITPAGSLTDYDVSLTDTKTIKQIKIESVTASKGRMYCHSIKVVAASAAPSHTITATSNNNSYGTVSVSGTTITATPNDGYRVKSGDAGYTVTSGTAVVTNNGNNTFSVTPSSNCAITINFEAIPTYTINWHTAVGTVVDEVLEEGATITKPATNPTKDGYEFMGWTEDCEVASDGAGFTAITNFGTATEDKDYYAVFAKAEITGGGGTTTETLEGSDVSYSGNNGYVNFTATTSSGTWSGKGNYNTKGYIQINKNNNNYHIGSPTFASNVTSIKITTTNNSAANRTFYICSSNSTAQPSSGNLGSHMTTVANESFTIDLTTDAKQFYIYSSGAVYISQIDVTFAGGTTTYSDYITTCATAPVVPIATVDPTSVTTIAAGAGGKVTVTYENVNTANVSVALYNDNACTEAFSADWLTASLDGDKNITYTVAENPTYAERKAYIQLTAPETTGATEPAVVVIPVTQAGKDKVFASLEALLAAITPTSEGVEVTVTLTNEVIQDFYTSGLYRNGIALNVPYQAGVKVIEIYCKDVPAEWVKGGKVSGTITCPWKLYNSTWELCPTAWTELTYTAPATVKSIAVSGTPTKTTYVDGEAFDPTGLVVTATLTDDSTEPIDVALVDWTFNPETLSKGETSVSVVATYNTMASAAYEVTGLTVNDIPTKTVAEFIAAEGGRCYLEGFVSNITNTTYGNFDLTDASGTIYIYGCLNEAGESQQFAALGVKNGDKIKVIADEYELYGGTKDEAKNVQYVSHISTATISIADITIKVGEIKTIEATITPDAAQSEVQYAITSGNDYITLDGTTITAVAAGTATITATIAEKVGEYYGATMTFTVTVPTTYDVTWLVNGDEWATTESVEKGTQVASLPSEPTDECGGKAFVGWSTQTVTDGNKPAVLFTDAANSPTIDDNTTFHAVFATASGEEIVTSSLPRNIVYWEKQEITANEGISATTGSGTMTSNVTLSTKSNRTYQSTINKYAQIILSDLNLEDYTNINLSFWARGSQEGSITIKTNLSDDAITTFNITGTETLYVVNNIPASATSIILSYGANSGSLFFGTVKIYENTTITYPFTKLTEDNTNGWTGDDWDGYYLITNAQNPLRALDGNSIGEKFHQEVTDEDGTIETSLSMAFLISSTQNGFTIKGVGDNLYLAPGNNSISVSSEAEYYTIGHNKIEAQSSILSWNISGSKFGFYGAIITSAPQLYKIMRFYSDYTTSCLDVNWTITEGGSLSTTSGITTTVIPNEGYTYGEPAYTITDGSATVTQNGNIFTAVPTTDCTIQINMVQKTTYTVTWMVNGKEYTEGDPSAKVYMNEKISTIPTVPNPNAYCGDVFVGWTDAENGEYVHGTSNLYATPQEFPTASADQIFYAVFADYEQQ